MFVHISATKSKRARRWRKMEVISDVRPLPWERHCLGHWPFYTFQYSFLPHHSLVFLWYSFTKPDGNITETTRHQDLHFALTWNLFLFHVQVGCCFPADALRLTRIKFTHCLECSGGGKERHKDRKRGRDTWDAYALSLTLKWNPYVWGLQSPDSRLSCLLGEVVYWCYFPMESKSLSERNAGS